MNSKKHPKVWIFHTFVSPFSLFFVIAYIDKSRFGQGIKKDTMKQQPAPLYLSLLKSVLANYFDSLVTDTNDVHTVCIQNSIHLICT